MAKMHKIELSRGMLAHIAKRRGGKPHALEQLDPAKRP